MKARHLIVATLLLLITGVAQAAPSPWEIDAAHSGVYFDIKHIFATIRGHFEDYSAQLTMDPDNITEATCSFTVQTKSITTYNRKRDTHLRSAEFFDTANHPTMTFKSTKILPKGGNRFTMEGDLTIRGITKKISAPLTFHGTKLNPLKTTQMVSGFTTQFTINRLDFGVGNGKFFEMGVIDKEVDITISIEAVN